MSDAKRPGFRHAISAAPAGGAHAGALGSAFHREDPIWTGIALVVRLHFLPLGVMFRMRPYLVAAAAGTCVATAALGLPAAVLWPASRVVVVGVGMGAVVGATAAYAIGRADGLARAWARGVSSS